VFEGNGVVRDYYGTSKDYFWDKSHTTSTKKQISTDFREGTFQTGLTADRLRETGNQEPAASDRKHVTKKLSFKEKREHEQLEKEIEKLEDEKAAIERELGSGVPAYEELAAKTARLAEVMEQLDEKMLRWMELDERS